MNRPNLTVITLLLALAALAPTTWSDTVKLKSGEVLEGEIVAEAPDSVVIRVAVSASISEEKTIPRTDILSIEKPTEAEIAYEKLAKLELGKNSLQLEVYDRVLDQHLKPYLAKYPDSPFKVEVENKISLFEEERDKVAEGALKIDGQWLAKELVEAERYQIEARLALRTMRERAAQRDFVGALNKFDALQREYRNALVLPEAVGVAKQVAAALQKDIAARIEKLEREEADWEKKIQLTAEHRQPQVKAAKAARESRIRAAIAAAREQRITWPPVLPDKAHLENIRRRAELEVKRLESMDLSRQIEAVQLVAEARQLTAKQKFTEAEAALAKAKESWPTLESAERLLAEATALKEKQEQGAKAAAMAEEAAAAAAAHEEAQKKAEEEEKKQAMQKAAKKNFFMTVPGALVVIIVIGIIVGVISILLRPRGSQIHH